MLRVLSPMGNLAEVSGVMAVEYQKPRRGSGLVIDGGESPAHSNGATPGSFPAEWGPSIFERSDLIRGTEHIACRR